MPYLVFSEKFLALVNEVCNSEGNDLALIQLEAE